MMNDEKLAADVTHSHHPPRYRAWTRTTNCKLVSEVSELDYRVDGRTLIGR